jgi:hypothetical protein
MRFLLTTTVLLCGLVLGCQGLSSAAADLLATAESGDEAIRARATVTSGPYPGSPHRNCTWTAVAPGTPGFEYATAKVEDGISYQLYERVCDAVPAHIWIPIVTDPANLLAQLLDQLRKTDLPHPRPVFHELDHEFGWAYVHVPLDFRADPADWHTVTITASIDGPTPLWATVRATPTTLAFDPGNGTSETGCGAAGALAPYEPKFAGACSYTYVHASSTADDGYYFHPTVTIEWTIEWQSSLDATWRPLTPQRTSTTTPLAVAEIQALITCTGPKPAQGGCSG